VISSRSSAMGEPDGKARSDKPTENERGLPPAVTLSSNSGVHARWWCSKVNGHNHKGAKLCGNSDGSACV
jgi:hypothetical protein